MSNLPTSTDMQKYFFRASAEDFQKIPGSPIAYWVSRDTLNIFEQSPQLGDVVNAKVGLQTGDNNQFLRLWHEASFNNIGFGMESREQAQQSGKRWFPYNKGGSFRKWYGNQEYVVNWENDGQEIRNFKDENGKVRSRPQNLDYYFQEGITWGDITTKTFAARYTQAGSVFDVKGSSGFPDHKDLYQLIGLLDSKLMHQFMMILNPTSTFQVGDMKRVPFIRNTPHQDQINITVRQLIKLTCHDWDSYETSWDFTTLPLLRTEHRGETLEETYQNLRAYWQSQTDEMQRLEAENNRIFIEAYGLEDELTPEVPLEEITLTCNPHYRYRLSGKAWEGASDDEKNEERERRLVQDTVKEFVSYAVGCMFGRYSLEKEGLVLANQGETLADYLEQIPTPSFTPTEDNVLVVLDEDWFKDDIVACFQKFLKLTFGEKHYHTNLSFIEEALSNHKKSTSSLRDYFVKEFYKDHVQTYKKRPIYWMFSSPSGSFQALIYMHRYRTDTASVVLNDYLREYRDKLLLRVESLKAASDNEELSASARTRALKKVDKLKKVVAELDVYEKEELYPLATEQKSIDLDDGVQVNYEAFGMALKKF